MTDTEEDYEDDDYTMDFDTYFMYFQDDFTQNNFGFMMDYLVNGYVYGSEETVEDIPGYERNDVAEIELDTARERWGNIRVPAGVIDSRRSRGSGVDRAGFMDIGNNRNLGQVLNSGNFNGDSWEDILQKITIDGYEDQEGGTFYRFELEQGYIYLDPRDNDEIERLQEPEDEQVVWERVMERAYNDAEDRFDVLENENDELMEAIDDDDEVAFGDVIIDAFVNIYIDYANTVDEDVLDSYDLTGRGGWDRLVEGWANKREDLYNNFREGNRLNAAEMYDYIVMDEDIGFTTGRGVAQRVGTNYQRNIFPDGAPRPTSPSPFGDLDAIKRELQEDFDDFMNEFKDSLIRANAYGFWRELNMKPSFKYANYDDWNSKKVKIVGGIKKVNSNEKLNIVLFNRLFEFYEDCYKRNPGACRTHRNQFNSLRSELKGVNDISVMNTTVIPQVVMRPDFKNLVVWYEGLADTTRAPRRPPSPSRRRGEAEDDESPVAETEAEPTVVSQEQLGDNPSALDAMIMGMLVEGGANAAFLRRTYGITN